MTVEALVTLGILTLTVLLLITEWLPPGVTGLCAIVGLALTGVLSTEEAFSGLANGAVITVASMYVISAAVVRTGAAAAVASRLSHPGRSPMGAYRLLLVATMVLSGFVNNTPLILIFLPLVLGLAGRMDEKPSKLLIPLSFVSILGGSATLIGTSTNLIVASSIRDASDGAIQLNMFTFTRLGVILAAVGGLLVVLLRNRLLPDRPSLGLLQQKGVAVEYVTEVAVLAGGDLAGKTLGELERRSTLGEGVRILQVVRGEVVRVPDPDVELEVGDLLLVKGDPEAVLKLRLADGQRAASGGRSDAVRGLGLTLFELVVTPGSSWIGRTVENLELHDRYDTSVFAVQRRDAHLREQIERLALQPGDVLLLQGTEESMRRLRDTSGVLVVEGVNSIRQDTRLAPLVFLG